MVFSQGVLVYVWNGLGLRRRKEGERKFATSGLGWRVVLKASGRMRLPAAGRQNVRLPHHPSPFLALSSSLHHYRGPQLATMSHTQRPFSICCTYPQGTYLPTILSSAIADKNDGPAASANMCSARLWQIVWRNGYAIKWISLK